MRINETYVNATSDMIFGESGNYEPYTDNVGRLFRDFQKEYGGCVSKVYTDTKNGAVPHGWVFRKRMKYEDARRSREQDFYVREVWVDFRNEDGTPFRIN